MPDDKLWRECEPGADGAVSAEIMERSGGSIFDTHKVWLRPADVIHRDAHRALGLPLGEDSAEAWAKAAGEQSAAAVTYRALAVEALRALEPFAEIWQEFNADHNWDSLSQLVAKRDTPERTGIFQRADAVLSRPDVAALLKESGVPTGHH